MELQEGNQSKVSVAARKMQDLLIESEAYDPSTGWVNIDRTWQDPARLAQFTEHLLEYIQAVGLADSITSILAADKVRFPFGLIPAASLLSTRLGVPLGIWKENANILTGAAHVFGQATSDHILLLHDVAVRGLTALRVILFLHATHKCTPRTVLSVVDAEIECRNGRTAGEFITKEVSERTGQRISYLRIIPMSALRGD